MQPNPYAAPRAPSKPSISRAAGPHDPSGYRSPRVLGQVTIALCSLNLAIILFVVTATIFSSGQFKVPGSWKHVATVPDYLGMVAFFWWTHRTAANVSRFGQPMSWTPAMCVVWFFVPIANLIMPARVVGQIESASQAERIRAAIPFAYGWWFSYVVALTINLWLGWLLRRGAIGPGLAYAMTVFATVAQSASLTMLILVIRRVANGQDALHAVAVSAASS